MTTALTRQLTPDQKHALDVLRAGESFMLVGHMRPDGDCIGAQGALARGLASLGKRVFIINPDQPGEEFQYVYEGCDFRVFDGESLPAHGVTVILDFNELSRTGAMAEAIAATDSKKLVIDHHPFEGEPWWDASYVDISASATGVLAWRILKQLGVEPDAGSAASVFTSMVTDTGWFRYSNTDSETMQTAADTLKQGINPAQVYNAVYQQKPATEPAGIAALLNRIEFYGEDRLAVIAQPADCFSAKAGTDPDPVLDILRSVKTVEVVLFVRELGQGICKLSARSKTDYNVNALARQFGGGGHVKASGATIKGDLTEVKNRLVAAALEGFSAG